MKNYLVTGGSGFFGSVLLDHLLERGDRCVNVDLWPSVSAHPRKADVICDISDRACVDEVFRTHGPFEAVFHVAAKLAHSEKSEEALLTSNVGGTANVADACTEHGTSNLVFISSNCLWGRPLGRPVREEDEPAPIEAYGRSKMLAERALIERSARLHSAILRVPTIISAGRLGLLAILFEFIEDDKTAWLVGKGDNRYQFIYAPDLADACVRTAQLDKTAVYNVGSDDPKTLREIYEYVIAKAGSSSRVRSIPRFPTLAAMRFAHALGLSPLGPYHYRMISESFEFNTSRIKSETEWRPTRSNEEMLAEAFRYYQEHRGEILHRDKVSAHRMQTKMGLIRLLKWIS